MRKALAGTAVVVAATLAALAPATAGTLAPGPVRKQVGAAIERAYPTLPIGNVACPDDVRRARGITFICTAQVPGNFLVVRAKEVRGASRLEIAAEQAVLDRGLLEQFVAAQATLAATVNCGTGTWLVRRPGQTVACAAMLADGTARQVTVTVEDLAGTVTITAVA